MDVKFSTMLILIFGLTGIIFLVIAFFTFRAETRMRDGAITVPGVVTELEEVTDNEGSVLYKPVFEYYDNQDRKHRAKGGVASSPPGYKKGEEVSVLYRPENPEKAQLDSFFEAWFAPLIFGLLGSIFTLIASGALFLRLRASRSEARELRKYRPL